MELLSLSVACPYVGQIPTIRRLMSATDVFQRIFRRLRSPMGARAVNNFGINC